MPRRPARRDLTFYLLKDSVKELEDAIASADDLARYELDQPEGSVLYVRTPHGRPPWWVKFLRDGVPSLQDLENKNTAAVLLLMAKDRVFAVTFGYGRNLLALESCERDFGLRVALNVVNPDTLRSVDARTFEELTVMTRTQTSQMASFENFRINEVENILKAVTGTPQDSDFAHRITGADAAKITYVPVLDELKDKCCSLLDAFHSDGYKERFGFIDHLRTVRDPERLAALNEEVVRRLRDRDYDTIHLAPPEIIDLQEIESFTYEGLSDDTYDDLRIDDFRDLLSDSPPVDLSQLKKRKIGAIYRGSSEPHYRWTVYECIVGEVREEEHLYVLTSGVWYQVEKEFSAKVSADVTARMVGQNSLPAAIPGEDEPTYNRRAATESSMHLLDGKIVHPAGARSGIEFCDLLGNDKKLFHVKRRSRSSTLSHLFAQGVVSAETFNRDSTYRSSLIGTLRNQGLDEAAQLIPESGPVPRDWEIVFAIIGWRREEWPQSLPFFSQLHFKIAAERLGDLGFRVSITPIPYQDAPM